MRAVQAANPDIVFVAAYPPDTVGIVRAASEIGLNPEMFGGTMIGLLITPIKTQLGPLLNGIVIMESFVPAPSFNFPGVTDVLKRYQAKAGSEKIDPIGYAFVPFGYAAGQVLAQAVETGPRVSIRRSSPTTSITTRSTPWSARSITPPTAPGPSRAPCSRNFRTLPPAISSSFATAACSQFCGRRNIRAVR